MPPALLPKSLPLKGATRKGGANRALEASSGGPVWPRSSLQGSVHALRAGKWGYQLLSRVHLVGKLWGAPCLHARLPGFGEQQGEARLGEAGCTGARPGDRLCEVWLRRMEGKEEEKSSLLTSKSCNTGASREGGHAATKHREMEITTTEATAAAPAQP